MDNTERGELSRNIRSINHSMPRNYVERGVSRYDLKRKAQEEDSIEYQPKTMEEYRRERLRQEEEERQAAIDAAPIPESRFHPKGATYGSDGKEHSERAKHFQRRSSRPARQLEPDEEPPLLDTFRAAAQRRRESKRDFENRYKHSINGASRVEHIKEKNKNGTVIRDVEYYVPKLAGEETAELSASKRSKKKKRNRKPMKMWQKASITGICLFMAFLMSLGMGASALLNRMNFVQNEPANQRGSGSSYNAKADAEAAAEMDGVDDTEIELPDTPILFDSDIENILLIGSDRRSMSEEGRSDAMMMLTIDRKHKKLKMTSFLRDLYVKIPGKYGSKLNSAYSVGGVNLLKQTITANLGINVDKYIIVDFNAFKTVVNKIGKLNGKGGIKITVTGAEARYMCSHEKYGLFPRFSKGKGTYYMNGAEALNYARIRKIDSDFGRTKRQRKVLTEIMTELKDVSKVDLLSIAYSCLEYVTTDFSKGELVGLVTEAAQIANYETKQISIPIKGSYSVQKMSNGNEALAANLSVNSDKLIKYIYDDDMTYEGNEKEIRGIYLPNLKGIANSKLTTRKDTTSTTAGEGDTTEKGSTKSTTAKGSAKSTTAKGSAKSTTAKGSTKSTTAKGTTKSTTAKGTTKSTTAKGTTKSTSKAG